MGVKRFDFIRDRERRDSWMEEASLGQYVKSADYDALAAELAWYHKDSTKLISEYEVRLRELEAALRFWMPSVQPSFDAERWYKDRALVFSSTAETAGKPIWACGCTSQSGCQHRTDRICVMETVAKLRCKVCSNDHYPTCDAGPCINCGWPAADCIRGKCCKNCHHSGSDQAVKP